MSKHTKYEQVEEPGYETRDLKAGGLYGFFITLAIATAAVFVIMLGCVSFYGLF